MKYYILKAKSASVDENIIAGIKESDGNAVIASSSDACDIVVLQNGFTRSKIAVAEWKRLREGGKPCMEGNLYLDKWNAKPSK